MTKTFRFDDVSVNTHADKLVSMIGVIFQHAPMSRILLAVSPIVFCPENQLPGGHEERVHPSRLTAMSSLSPYFEGHRCGLPVALQRIYHNDSRIVFAGHGLVHVDHRLLPAAAQEMSVVASAHLARGRRDQKLMFIPPYNKWDVNTEFICRQHDIDLVKFEDGWEHVLYNRYNPEHERYYLHPYDVSVERLDAWFRNEHATITVPASAPVRNDYLTEDTY